MEFRLLGPLEVICRGRALPPLANKPRALLAVLLLHRGEAVTLERLADDLWGERPPATATKSIQVYVSQLRKALGEGVLETRGHGYALMVEPDHVDAVRFERMLEQGAEHLAGGRAREAADVLSQALGLWRGPALADFSYESWARAEITRLEDLRLAATEERIDADLALGRHGTLIAELEGLVERHPTRERLCGQLMLALYRSGRQTDALEAFRHRRRTLVEELGIEPSPALRDLEAAILRHDPALEGPVRSPAAMLRRRRGGILIALGGAAVLLAGLAAGVVALLGAANPPAGEALKPLSASFCSPMAYGAGARPRHLVISDQGFGGSTGVLGSQITAAVEFVLQENEFRAGRRAVAYQACDSSGDEGCAAKARQYAEHPAVLGVVGPLGSTCAGEILPVANAARSGPLVLVSPSNTSVALTRRVPGGRPDEPERFYPRGVRNYVRVIAADDFQFAANAMLARRLGIERVFVLAGDAFFKESARAFYTAAERLGLSVVGFGTWVDVHDYRSLARRVERARADGVFLAGGAPEDGVQLLRALRGVLGRDVLLFAPDGFSEPDLLARAGPAGEGMYVSVPGVDPRALTGSGRKLVDRLREAVGEPHPYTVSAAQATQMLLDAIGRSDGTRRSVIKALFAGEVRGGLLGDFSVTSTGDTTANRVTIYRIEKGERRVDRVLTPPLSLVVPR